MAELELDARQVRNFRLQAHHLDAFYGRDDALAAVDDLVLKAVG